MSSRKQITFPLKIVFWETTGKCNLNCKYCRRISENYGNELTTQDAKNFIDTLNIIAKTQNQPVVLIFSGGEPLLRDDIFELANYAHQVNLPTALATNGTLINRQIAQKLKSANFHRIAISIDGYNPETHDKIINKPGSFELAINGIKLLQKNNINVQINSTISKINASYTDKILLLVQSLNVQAWHIFMFVPVGCGAKLDDSQKLSGTEIENILHKIYQYSQQSSLQIKPTCLPQYYRILKQHGALSSQNLLHRYTRGCLAGINICFISAKGDVFPCGYLPISAGNILETPLEEIWNNSQLFAKLRTFSNIKGKCGKCKYLDICGGCRAQAYAKNSDFLDEDPYCIYQPS